MHNPQERFDYQNVLYEFPYHYLPHFSADGTPRLHRHLAWGLDYLTYTTFVTEQIRQISPRSLLDIGCGDGRLIHMVKTFVPRVSGVDLSQQAIAFSRAFNADVEFHCADIGTLQGHYECVTLIEVLEHIPDEEMSSFMRNVARLVHKSGYILVSVPTVNVPLNIKHYRHYDLAMLQTTLLPHFHIENKWWLYRRGFFEFCLRNFVANPFYILNFSPLLSRIWRIHRRKTYFGDSRTAAHLVCLAKRRASALGQCCLLKHC